ncbi:MAG: iron(III) transport system permease protein [Verrucomicrobiales bacterium]|jgi:iron(III) transport system permease protein
MLRTFRHINASLIAFVLMMAFFSAFFVLPIVTTLKEAFIYKGEFTTAYVTTVLGDSNYLAGLGNAFVCAILSTIGAVLIAMPLAILADRYKFPFKGLLSSLLLIPLVLPPFVGAIGIKQLLGQSGALNVFLSWFGLVDMDNPVDWIGDHRFAGMVLMNALHLYPIIFLNVTAALANLDPAMEESAENLGCSPRRRFLQITLPLTLPGLFAGCTIVFIWSFTELGVPLIFDYTRITSVQIFDGIKDLRSNNPFPYALVAVVLIITSVIFIVGKKLAGGKDLSSSGRASVGRTAEVLYGWKGRCCSLAFLAVIFIASIPHLGVLLVSLSGDWYQSVLPNSFTLEHFEEALGHTLTLPSIANSLKYAGLATGLNIVLGVAIAYVISRTKIRGRQVLDVMAMMPLAVPGLVLAFGYLAMTREGQPLRFLLDNPFIEFENPIFLLVIAYAVRRLPYIVRSAVAGFQQTSSSLEEAAQNLGAHPLKALMKITIPLIAANLIAGAMLAFAFSMLEVSDSLILAQRQAHFPITAAIYNLFVGSLGNGSFLAAALGVWAMTFLAVSIVGAGLLLGKKMGALFRV